ncbi:MAG: DUF1361 domain-containing protein [Cytophaga sp.]|uniref:DUF1361 domain-containing protein n=1 Tax=Cytophaga sp. TaxID=29535 RepID=UPI003F7F0E75
MKNKLLLLSLLCLALEVGRMLYSGSLSYIFLLWNLFLAAIPYLVSLHIQRTQNSIPKLIGKSMLWLLFLPNALYIITDLKHLHERPPIPEWFDCLLLFSYSTLALFFGLLSLYNMHQVFKRYASAFTQHTIVFCISLLAGFGVYLGREERWNSWDLFTNPLDLISECLSLSTVPHVWAFSTCYGIAFLIMYYIISSLIHYPHETPNQLA